MAFRSRTCSGPNFLLRDVADSSLGPNDYQRSPHDRDSWAHEHFHQPGDRTRPDTDPIYHTNRYFHQRQHDPLDNNSTSRDSDDYDNSARDD